MKKERKAMRGKCGKKQKCLRKREKGQTACKKGLRRVKFAYMVRVKVAAIWKAGKKLCTNEGKSAAGSY